MFYLHVSNRTENLLEQLSEVIAIDKQPGLFAAELFLIQSQGMERMVSQTLATTLGSFCNFKFFLPLDFLEHIATILNIDCSTANYSRQLLTWRIDELLRELKGDLYSPLRNYIEGSNSDLKRFQLAGHLAYVFDQYQIMRPDLISMWEKGQRGTEHDSELYQMALWNRLTAQPSGKDHRGLLFAKTIEILASDKGIGNTKKLPKRISVVGLHSMPPVYLDYLCALSSHIDVHFLLLSPCENYWGNVENRKEIIQKKIQSLENVADTGDSSQHPLLIALGRQGRDLQNMLLDKADVALEFASYKDPTNGESSATLLHNLQKDLLKGALPTERLAEKSIDDSIQIVSCHSKQRELMVLKDHLLRLLYQNPDLELRNIVVMTPDIQEYSSLIPGLFSDIQHSISDRSVRFKNSAIQAFILFLDLTHGRYGWSEVMDVLRQQSVYPQFHLMARDLDILQEWIIAAGVRWGLSADQRVEAGSGGGGSSTWGTGLDRLLMGYAVDSKEYVDGVLPFTELEGRAASPLGGLCEFIDILERAGKDFGLRHDLKTWSELLLSYVEQLLGSGHERELVELRTMVTDLAIPWEKFHTQAVNFEVIQEWFQKATNESRSSSGFLRGHLTFCSMLPMRSIPFKVVCLLGLNNGVFPKQDKNDTFDLMVDDFRVGDRSARADDRYQFLEAILATRSHLYLSYIGQSIKNNKPVPPAVVVTELLDILESCYDARELVVKHPLHPFSRKYFDEKEVSLFSYNNYYCRTAQLLQEDKKSPGKWWQTELPWEKRAVPLRELITFYNNPQKYFLEYCLGVNLSDSDGLVEDRELFEIQGLDKYGAEQLMLGAVMTDQSDQLYERLQDSGQWTLGNPGEISFESSFDTVSHYSEIVKKQNFGSPVASHPIELEFEQCTLTGVLSNLYEEGVMILRFGKLRGKDLIKAWLHHQLLLRLGLGDSTRLVATDMVIGWTGVQQQPSLEALVRLFVSGCKQPICFFPEPSLTYVQQQTKSRARTSPLQAATKTFIHRLEKGYEPEIALLYQTEDIETLLGTEFEAYCKDIFLAIWESRDE